MSSGWSSFFVPVRLWDFASNRHKSRRACGELQSIISKISAAHWEFKHVLVHQATEHINWFTSHCFTRHCWLTRRRWTSPWARTWPPPWLLGRLKDCPESARVAKGPRWLSGFLKSWEVTPIDQLIRTWWWLLGTPKLSSKWCVKFQMSSHVFFFTPPAVVLFLKKYIFFLAGEETTWQDRYGLASSIFAPIIFPNHETMDFKLHGFWGLDFSGKFHHRFHQSWLAQRVLAMNLRWGRIHQVRFSWCIACSVVVIVLVAAGWGVSPHPRGNISCFAPVRFSKCVTLHQLAPLDNHQIPLIKSYQQDIQGSLVQICSYPVIRSGSRFGVLWQSPYSQNIFPKKKKKNLGSSSELRVAPGIHDAHGHAVAPGMSSISARDQSRNLGIFGRRFWMPIIVQVHTGMVAI